MKLVVDANVFFSSMLRKGLTRKLFFNPETKLFAPEFLLQEILKYEKELLKKYSGRREEFYKLFKLLVKQINFVPDKYLKPYLPAASSLSNGSKDWLYLACALYADAVIWTRDKEFQKQKRVKIKTTVQLAKELGSL